MYDSSLRKQLRRARELGCNIYKPRKTGEVVVAHTAMDERVRVNCRRHSAPRQLTTFLKRLEALGDAA